jgi:hypothetical protein
LRNSLNNQQDMLSDFIFVSFFLRSAVMAEEPTINSVFPGEYDEIVLQQLLEETLNEIDEVQVKII